MYIFSEQIYLNGTVLLLTLRPVFLIESLIYLDLNVQNIKLIQNFHYNVVSNKIRDFMLPLLFMEHKIISCSTFLDYE